MQHSSRSDFVRGVIYRLSAVSIWAAFIVVSRLGVRTSLTPWDVVAIRFGVAGVLLLSYFLKKGLALDRLGWVGLAAISVGCGMRPYNNRATTAVRLPCTTAWSPHQQGA